MNLKDISKVTLESSSEKLTQGFTWAKGQALEYVHFNDPVGDWYDAALPNREAFCMRDIFHQCNGGQVLGLRSHNKNMLKKFAENISEIRDYCTYWEINRYDKPAPVDYKDDDDFWYNLPANFDMIDCCLRQYLWTGDRDYIEDPVFLNFYDKSIKEYVEAWDLNKDGILEHKGQCHRRGIPSYIESDVGRRELLAGSDLISAMFAGYRAYGEIQRLRGNFEKAEVYIKKSEEIKEFFNKQWWSRDLGNYLTSWYKDGEKVGTSLENANANSDLVTSLPLYFNITEAGDKTEIALQTLNSAKKVNIETKSHFPEVLYKYEKAAEALDILYELTDENTNRREYPEVSYSVIGAIITGILGVTPNYAKREIETLPRLTEHIDWVGVNHIPVFNGEISIKYMKNNQAELVNNTGEDFTWKVTFKGQMNEIKINNECYEAEKEARRNGQIYSYVKVNIKDGQQLTAIGC